MKATQRIAAIAATAAIALSGCAKTDESKADSSTKDSTEKTLAEQVSDHLNSGEYAIDMTISGDGYETEMPCKMTAKDGNGFISMTTSGVYTEFYTVDDKTYMLMPDISCYQVTDEDGAFGNAFLKIGEGDELLSEENADGVITEVYTSRSDDEDENERYTFVFDAESEQLKSFTSETSEGTTTATINSINWSGAQITLPDLTGWNDISDSTDIDETTQLKFTLYFMGVTEEDVSEAGYTYEELAKMSQDELNEALEKMGVSIYG